ncbi:hypothetical protein JZ751_012444 [Albula glossodonta]|uniref:5'-nucleotidase n=1 Tax=Albula glossodonta TaxID=121402 RepID=A0A8T2NUT5_9TELE|nr:hypothetical protein JZ751_012444 [Albula glossodonta]
MTAKDSTLLTQIPELARPCVYMQNSQRVEEVIQAMQRAGPNTLQVISDFDMTLTRFSYNGKRCPTCHNILDNSKLISEECKEKLKDLLNTYYPIEIDSGRSVEEKLPLMVEWEGYNVFFDQLQEHSIPLLIFSAGIGDVLEEVIRQAGVFYPNVKVFSNYMDFDESGALRAFKGELIHIYNKREGALLNSGHFQELRARHNVLLLGDSLGDLTMADGVHSTENILKIGYLNDKVEERREAYLKAFDIVLEKDETMDIANAILLHITRGQ